MTDEAGTLQPLNAELYRRLRARFQSLVIANEGDRAVGSPIRDPIDPRRVRMQMSTWGEYYRVCCPYCQDTRHRLWINHMYGQADEVAGFPKTWLAVCYNEGCIDGPGRRQALEELVFGFRNRRDRHRTINIAIPDTGEQVLTPVTPPGEILRLTELPANHPAIQYLCGRGYDPAHLSEYYGIGFCLTVNSPDYYPMRGRIYIPVWMENALVGWQGRFVGDTNWQTTAKYFGRKGMAKRSMLYNYDTAKAWPFVVVVESAASVWKVGGPCVGLLGKTLSGAQRTLLQRTWPGKLIVLILDPDARDEMEGILNEMRLSAVNPIVPLYLPADHDPGNYTHEANVGMIQAAARQSGFELPNW